MLRKEGVFFTIDALLASGIVILAIILISNFYSYEQQKVNVNYASQDLVKVFSSLTVGQANNDYVKNLTLSGIITNTNNSVLEQIGEFWAEGKTDLAKNFTRNLTEGIISDAYGFSVLVNGEEIYKRDLPVKRTLVSSRKIISGIAKAKPTKGFTARVLLSGIKSKKTNAYVYFGGYEGDGNLTKKLILPNDVISFNSSYLEVEAGGNFNLNINGLFSGSYAKGSGGGGYMLADKWNISNAYLPNFKSGENNITINFTSGSSYIAGGFLRVAYITSSYNDTSIPGHERYDFPGIDGVINLYSSIYAPNEPSSMNISLHFLSQYSVYLSIGNTTVFESNSSTGEQTAFINNSNLSGALNYASLGQKTVPLRLGLKGANITVPGKISDSVLITDRTGSMSACDITVNCTAGLCDSNPTGGCHDRRDNVAIKADKKFINSVLEANGSKVALVGFGTDASPVCDFHDFSDDNISLTHRVNNYSNEWCGNTCISCGIHATTGLLTENEALYGLKLKSAINTTQFRVGDSDSKVSVSLNMSLNVNTTNVLKSRLTVLGKNVDTENNYLDCIYLNGRYLGRMCEPHHDPGWHTCSYPLKLDWLYSGKNVTSGLIGHWKLDESSGAYTNDSAGISTNGTLFGASRVTGLINNALNFDGNDYVEIPHSNVYLLNDGTVTFWFKPDIVNIQQGLWSKDSTGFDTGGHLTFFIWADSTFRVRLQSTTSEVWLTSSPISAGKWYHVSLTFGSNGMKFYINGALQATNPYTGGLGTSSGGIGNYEPLVIGANSWASNDLSPTPLQDYFRGVIDDVRFYNKALDANEIGDIYSSPLGNSVTITGGTTSGCQLTSGTNDNWDFQEVKLIAWESSSAPSTAYDSVATEVQIGDNPYDEISSSSLTINVEKSKMKSAMLEFEAIDVDPAYYDCVYVNGNYVGSVDYQEWSGTNEWQKILFDVPVAWLKNGANEVNLTSGTTSGCHQTSGNNDEWRFRNLNLSVVWTDEAASYDRSKAMLIMSDGEANSKIGDSSSSGAGTQAVEKACEAHNLYGISIYAVLFGDINNANARKTLNDSACCDDCSHFYTASSSDELLEIYSKIAESVGNITFQAQSVNLSAGNLARTILYPDSYLSFNYSVSESEFNKMPLSFETDRFSNNISTGTLTIYPNTSVSEAKVTSYSGTKWTDNLVVNGNNVYKLSDHGSEYLSLGDPFAVNIPINNLNTGSNSIAISTGLNSTASSGGSNDSRVIYTLLLNGFADYSSVVAKSDGCSWTVSFEDGSASIIKVPSSYVGADICSFAGKTYDSNDALDNAVFQLFNNLDLDKDGKLEVNIDASSLNINTLTVSKVPSLWGPAIIEIRVWE